jgi:glycosyltransferase involved in cell wall biosynthesis
MVFPAFAEGSGLVTMEAAAIGLPILTVEGSGAPESSRYVEARSEGALREGIEEILDDEDLLEGVSCRLVAESKARTAERFFGELGAVAASLLELSDGTSESPFC